MIVAHGNGNSLSDNSEAEALQGHHAPVTAFKWAMGHTLCASGILDAVLASYALKNQVIPGIAPLQEKAAECSDLNLSAETRPLPEKNSPHHALLISRGFGSMNTALLMASCV
jgi:3-oxoacyl-[acyl-carrier-protein] synthase-1